jgi:lipid II:glycine glycyltransferase (peptidoglycan interpeptide bridge formation enzyme)
LEVSFDDGAFAVIPFAKIKRIGGLLIDHFSSPGGTYGGWVSTSSLSEDHIRILMNILISKKNLTFRINPLDKVLISMLIPLSQTSSPQTSPSSSMPSSLLEYLNFSARIKEDFTHILDLTKPETEIFQGFSRGHKSSINRAARDGVTVRPAETPDEWDKYYDLYMDSVDRWRSGGSGLRPRTIYPQSLFQRIYENRTGNETLWLALKDGEPVAGALFFYWGKHAVYWHGAASARHFGLRPNNLLHREIIKDAARNGYAHFDFNPSGGYAGVETFKDRFGATRAPSPVLTARTAFRAALEPLRSLSLR